ncbi:MAG: hypothetical protein AAF604_12795 [Acidobacteriota bacterium]
MGNYTDFDNIKTKRPAQAEQTRLATAQGLVYRAYSRPYGDGPANVLNLFASGFYGDAPWKMFFVPVDGKPNHYRLMEVVPSVVYFIVSYYTASYSSQVGLLELGDEIIVEDARGEHKVKVVPLT